MKIDRRFLAILACFVLSGFSALLYETVWTRQFAVVFGTSELAVSTVLAAYMAGLAAGAAGAARWANRVRRPLLAYGLLELGIGVGAVAVPSAIRGSTELCAALFGAQDVLPEAGGLTVALFYLTCSLAILLVPTGLMGATLPLLARFAVRREGELGSRVGVLYAANTAGAVGGTLVAAFVLLPAVGLFRTALVGVAANGLVFAVAMLLARGAVSLPAESPQAPARRAGFTRRTLILPLILVSGVASFTYEVLWTRLLGFILGGSIYAFATMLASFLVGIAGGSAVAARFARTSRGSVRGFVVAQLGIAVLSFLTFHGINYLPVAALKLGAGIGGGLLANAALAGLTLLPGALCIGATFPFAVRVLGRGASDAGPVSGRVYAWNTIGAIIGAAGAGFVVIPALGFESSLAAAVAINLALALAAALILQPVSRPMAVTALAGLALLPFARPGTPWNLLTTVPLNPGAWQGKPVDAEDIVYFGVGRSATVLLTRDLGRSGYLRLRANGLAEADIRPKGWHSIGKAEPWLSCLAVLARPDTGSMLIIGLGGGTTVGAVPGSVRSIDVIELEPRIVEANRAAASLRADDWRADPRVRVYLNDARGALALTRKRYDAIVSQPSHPWTAGASHLYTREFFTLVREHLLPGGVFVQWMNLEFVDEGLLRSLVATLTTVFPHVRLYMPQFTPPISVLFLGSSEPLTVEATAARAIENAPRDFGRYGVYGPEDVAAALILNEKGALKFAQGGAISTDDYNILQTRSPHVLDRGAEDLGSRMQLLASLEAPAEVGRELNRLKIVRRLLLDENVPRASRIAAAISDPAERLIALALVDRARGNLSQSRTKLREALDLNPGSLEARLELLLASLRGLLAGEPSVLELARPLPDPTKAVVESWLLAARGERDAGRSRDGRLAQASPTHPIYLHAGRLRVQWRLEAGDPVMAREAVALLDQMLGISRHPQDYLLCARACISANDPALAFGALEELVYHAGPHLGDPEFARAVKRLLGRIPADPDLDRRRGALLALLADGS